MAERKIHYENITIESVDRAIRDWFDLSVDCRVQSSDGQLRKVPVVFSSGERWAVGRTRQTFRDENGVLMLPVISVRRTSVEPNPAQTMLGTQVPKITFARRVDPKTNEIKNLEGPKHPSIKRDYPPVYDTYTIPFPSGMVATYQVVVQTQYITQMNDILEKMWRTLDIQKQFVAPLENNGRQQTPRNTQMQMEGVEHIMRKPYVVGFMDSSANDSGNFEEFTDTERIVKYQTDVKVPWVMFNQPEGQEPSVKVERSAYKLVIKDENVRFVDDPEELDKIFGNSR
jgi:hypothetical protein